MDKSMVKQSQELVSKNKAQTLEKLLIRGDLSALSDDDRLRYVEQLCKIMGVNILMRPFDFIKTKTGGILLYANRSCTEQLRKKHRISISIVSRERVGDLYVVTANASMPKEKREDSSIGAVNTAGLRGEDLSNALMKAETKAKRRVTLSLCGLGMLDELEARQVAEKQIEEANQEAVTQVEEKVQDSKERPEFESIQAPTSDPEPGSQPEATTIGDYILLAGKNKGKRLKNMPMSKLTAWIKWYEAHLAAGKELHPDVQLDAFNISQFMEEAMLSKEQKNAEEQ